MGRKCLSSLCLSQPRICCFDTLRRSLNNQNGKSKNRDSMRDCSTCIQDCIFYVCWGGNHVFPPCREQIKWELQDLQSYSAKKTKQKNPTLFSKSFIHQSLRPGLVTSALLCDMDDKIIQVEAQLRVILYTHNAVCISLALLHFQYV